MAVDSIGVGKVYGDSTKNPQNIFVKEAKVSNVFKMAGDLSGIHKTGGGTFSSGDGGGGGEATEGSGSVDKFGVQATYATGAIKYDYRNNFRSDGKRFDFTGLGNRYASAELIAYFAMSNPPNDEVSGKMGGGRHSGKGKRVNTYDMGIHTKSGKSRWRMEEIHPRYSSGMGGGTGSGLKSSFIGYKFIHIIRPRDNLMELWQDTGNNDGSKPANQWKRVSRWVDTKWNFRKMLSDHQETIRVDGSGGVKSLKIKWASLREIASGDNTDSPNTGGGGGSGGGGGDTAVSGSYDHIGFTGGNRNGVLAFYTTSGYRAGAINKNHKECAANGFMQDEKDFRQTEISCYVKLNKSNGNGQFLAKVRGGAETGVGNCEGCGVGIALGYDGRYRFVKQRRYNDVISYSPWQNGIGDIQGKWIGFKAIFFNVSNGVKYQFFLDTNESNAWKKVYETTDNGQGSLGGEGAVCGGMTGQPITWGGPLAFLSWNLANDPDGIELKKISLREINPLVRGDSSDRPEEHGAYEPGEQYNPDDPYVPPDFDPGDPYGGPGTYTPGEPYVHPPYNPGDPYVPGPAYDPETGTFPKYVPPNIAQFTTNPVGLYPSPLSNVSEGGVAGADDSYSDPTSGTESGSGGSSGGGAASGDGTGSTGTGIDTPDFSQQQIMYERKLFWIRYNINYISGDACGVGKQPANRPLENIYSVAGDVWVDGNTYSRTGLFVANYNEDDDTKTSMFMNERIRDISVTIKKVGINTIIGDIHLRIRDEDLNIVSELGTISAELLSGNEQVFNVPCNHNTRRLRQHDHVSVEFDGNTQDDYIRVKVSQVDKIDGTNTGMFVYDGFEYRYDLFAEFGAIISV